MVSHIVAMFPPSRETSSPSSSSPPPQNPHPSPSPPPSLSPSSHSLTAPLLGGDSEGEREGGEGEKGGGRESAGHGLRGGGLASAVFNLSTTSIGAGIMALPATIKVLGLPLGIFAIILLGLLTDLSIALIMRFSSHLKLKSYGDLMFFSFGQKGRLVIQIFTIVHTWGSLIVYMIIMGDVLSGSSSAAVGKHHTGLLEEMFGPTFWNGRTPVLLSVSLFVLYPLISLRQIDSLMLTSAVSILLAVLFVLFVIWATVEKWIAGQLQPARWQPDTGATWQGFLQVFTVVPVMTNAFVCHYNIHPIYAELSHPTEARMRTVSRYSQSLCTFVYLLTAVFGYLLFGEDTATDVLANFDGQLGPSKVLQDLVRLGYVVHLMLVFPIVFFPLRQTVDEMFFPLHGTPLVRDSLRFGGLTFVLMSSIFVLSIFIPDIYVIFSFMGAIVAVSVGYTCPALVALKSKPGEIYPGEKWEVWIMLVLGLLVTTTGIFTDIVNLFLWIH